MKSLKELTKKYKYKYETEVFAKKIFTMLQEKLARDFETFYNKMFICSFLIAANVTEVTRPSFSEIANIFKTLEPNVLQFEESDLDRMLIYILKYFNWDILYIYNS